MSTWDREPAKYHRNVSECPIGFVSLENVWKERVWRSLKLREWQNNILNLFLIVITGIGIMSLIIVQYRTVWEVFNFFMINYVTDWRLNFQFKVKDTFSIKIQ